MSTITSPTTYASVSAALAAVADEFDGVVALYRLGNRVVLITDVGAHLLQGSEGNRFWTPMRELATS